MDELEKLLRKAQKKDREHLLVVLTALQSGKTEGLHVQKLTNSIYYRVRVGRFRIIFAFNRDHKCIEIRSVKLRTENTYK